MDLTEFLSHFRETDKTSPVKRKTRAASRAATTSRAKSTRATKKNKSRSQEPVYNIQNELEKEMATPTRQEVEEEMVVQEETVTWMQPAAANVLAPQYRISADECKTPVNNRLVTDVDKTPVNKTRSPLHNFSTMNVKEKVTAYEEILLISPATVEKKKPSPKQTSPHTPVNTVSVPGTPNTVVTINVPNTPDTVITSKVISIVNSDSSDSPAEELSKAPERRSSQKKNTPRLSVPKKSHRASLRTSLRMLTSKKKLSHVSVEEVINGSNNCKYESLRGFTL
mgnify:CR=1 FL=1